MSWDLVYSAVSALFAIAITVEVLSLFTKKK